MDLKIGTKVRVAFDPKYKIIDGSRKFDGMDFEVTRKVIHKGPADSRSYGAYYELKGAESQAHVPYGFTEQNLIPLID